MNNKKKVIIHYNNLPEEVLEALNLKYPEGYSNFIKKYPKPDNSFFHAITLDTEDTSYLIKVNVKIDNINKEKLEEQIFASDDIKEPDVLPEDEAQPEEDKEAE